MSATYAEYAVLIGFLISWVVAGLWAAPAAKHASPLAQAPNLIVTTLGLGLLFAPAGRLAAVNFWRTPEPVAWILVVVTLAGVAICWWARLHLGALWSGTVTSKAGHRIVETGPYRLVRHPIYTGIIVALAGAAGQRGTSDAFLGLALVSLGFVMKARLEEGFLKAQLGEAAYAGYAARTPMLIPWFSRSKT